MLEQLRKHATNWVVKGTLAIIILTFILFFGWSRISDRYQDAHLYVAVVDGEGIPRRKFENMVEASRDRLRQSIEGSLPETMEDLLRKNVLDQLVTREVIVQFAGRLGLSVSDEEVADAIRNHTDLFQGGAFDLHAYERNFLPAYRQRYGEEFEDSIRRDLLIEKTQALMLTLYVPWEKELDSSLQETQKSESQPVASASPLDLFSDWIQDLRQKTEIQTY